MIVLFGAFWIYGWAGEISLVTDNTQPSNYTSQSMYAKMVIATGIFTIIGFGMVFTFYKKSSAISFFVSLFVVSFTVITGPIL